MLVLINLQRADVRRARMTAQLDDHGVPFERLGHDFRGHDRSEIVRWYAANFPSIRPAPGALSGAELGCWASHLSAWVRIQQSGETAGTVLEDDLALAPGFGACVRELEDDLGDFDLVYLGTSSRNLSRRRVTTIGRHRVHAPVGLVVNTWGYVVSSRWIGRAFAHPSLAVSMPIDHFLGGRGGPAKPRIGVVQPPCVHEDPPPHATRRSSLTPGDRTGFGWSKGCAAASSTAARASGSTAFTGGCSPAPRVAACQGTIRCRARRRQVSPCASPHWGQVIESKALCVCFHRKCCAAWPGLTGQAAGCYNFTFRRRGSRAVKGSRL